MNIVPLEDPRSNCWGGRGGEEKRGGGREEADGDWEV